MNERQQQNFDEMKAVLIPRLLERKRAREKDLQDRVERITQSDAFKFMFRRTS